MDTKFVRNVSIRMLLNAAKFYCYSFYLFWVIKGKQTGEGGLYHPPSPPPPRLGLKYEQYIFIINDPAGTERNNFQQLIKIDWTKIYFNNLTTIVYYYK